MHSFMTQVSGINSGSVAQYGLGIVQMPWFYQRFFCFMGVSLNNKECLRAAKAFTIQVSRSIFIPPGYRWIIISYSGDIQHNADISALGDEK